MKKVMAGLLFSVVYITMLPLLSSFEVLNNTWPYDFMVLAQTWPPTYCIHKATCSRPIIRDKFTIHGLWDNYVYPRRSPSPCPPIPFVPQLVASLRPTLDQHWPNLININDNESFWSYEWTKHGACITNNMNSYFAVTIYWKNKFDVLRILAKNGIYLGGQYNKRRITNVITREVKYDVVLKCVFIGRQYQYLWEVELCIDRQGRYLISCKSKNYTGGNQQCVDYKRIIIPA
ncbi:hypothetical protein RND81_03G221100 [Saponaria officinalis]|uniref:Uncharacterized protein n=1 Tax=Saponaria officinalis TaxID=3572 RepID=A0AAW1MAK6_SAPOF